MQLTMGGEYAIRAMLHSAAAPPGRVVQITEISARWQIPETFLRKITIMLSRAGLIYSQRVSGGGIQLAKLARELTLLDVIEAIEGKLSLNKCLVGPNACHHNGWCEVHHIWEETQSSMRKTLGGRSLALLTAQSREKRENGGSIQAAPYRIPAQISSINSST